MTGGGHTSVATLARNNKLNTKTRPRKPGAGLLYQWISVGKDLALQSLFHSHGHGNGSTDHGVVAHAQEAHHFNIKSALRRLCACGARLFRAANPTFHKSGNTSLIPIECAFLTGYILSYLLFTKQALLILLNILHHLFASRPICHPEAKVKNFLSDF